MFSLRNEKSKWLRKEVEIMKISFGRLAVDPVISQLHTPVCTQTNFHTSKLSLTHTHSIITNAFCGNPPLHQPVLTQTPCPRNYGLPFYTKQPVTQTIFLFLAPFCRMTVRWQGVPVSHSQFPLTKCRATSISPQGRRRRGGAGDGGMGAGGAIGNARAGC